jgi:hypothetical protein
MKKSYYEPVLRIAEVFPAPDRNSLVPSGHDEWIEIYNTSDVGQNLAGWMLDDDPEGGSTPKILPSSFVVPPKGYLQVASASLGLSLNNDGDEVILTDPNGTKIDQLKYSKIQKGKSIQSFGKTKRGKQDTCLSDIPTPGREAICYQFEDGKTAQDTDGDGVPDEREMLLYNTNPHVADTDGDGLPDGYELYADLDPLVKTVSGSLIQAYEAYLLEKLDPSWKLFSKKGLTLKADNMPIKELWFVFQDGYRIQADRLKSGNFDAVVKKSLKAGSYSVALELTDILNTKIVLPNALMINLDKDYVYTTKNKKASKKKAPKMKKKYVSVLAHGLSGSASENFVRDRLNANARSEQNAYKSSIILIFCIGILSMCLLMYGLRLKKRK